ncbi:hypothetical protein CC2G_006437 [Coprinopsis cinerea AmutBmut pab1-1]|nr:hypothetical protein CC2G_006437 [Coprinopsis cinerea AmutBmut pab1-1]
MAGVDGVTPSLEWAESPFKAAAKIIQAQFDPDDQYLETGNIISIIGNSLYRISASSPSHALALKFKEPFPKCSSKSTAKEACYLLTTGWLNYCRARMRTPLFVLLADSRLSSSHLNLALSDPVLRIDVDHPCPGYKSDQKGPSLRL